MDPVPIIVWGALVPAIITGLTMLLALRSARGAEIAASWVAGVAIGSAYLVGAWGLGQHAAGDDPNTRLLWLAIGGVVLGVVESRIDANRSLLRWTVRVTASLAAAWWLIAPLVGPQQLGALQIVGQLALIAAAVVLAWTILDLISADENGPTMAIVLALLVVGGSAVVVLSGLASTGQAAGALIAALGAAFLVTLRYPAPSRLRSAAPVLSLLLVGHWTTGWLYADMPTASLLLLFAAPATLLLGRLAPLRRATATMALLRMLAMAVPVSGAATAAAVLYFDESPTVTPSNASSDSAGHDDDYGY